MNQMLLHCGGQPASLPDLMSVPLPKETNSYKPVAHADLALNLMDVAGQILHGFEYSKSSYGIARNGNQLFGIHTYQNDDETNMGLSIGFRNSYDKSMSVGVAIGASVFVCDNLAMTGEITIMRKHTSNVNIDLEELMVSAIYKSQGNYKQVLEDAKQLSQIGFSNHDAYSQIGLLYGRGIITPRQIPVVKKNWLKPVQGDFQPRNAWSFYNAATEALKSCKPNKILERHIGLHKHLMQEVTGA